MQTSSKVSASSALALSSFTMTKPSPQSSWISLGLGINLNLMRLDLRTASACMVSWVVWKRRMKCLSVKAMRPEEAGGDGIVSPFIPAGDGGPLGRPRKIKVLRGEVFQELFELAHLFLVFFLVDDR